MIYYKEVHFEHFLYNFKFISLYYPYAVTPNLFMIYFSHSIHRSWKSLNQVRKMHFFASKSADKHNLGMISQTDMSLTMFGFMGYALIRPHVLGIQHDNNDDREAFVHFWATVGFMLGISDEYNICLFKLDIVEMICKICLRYIFIPLLQFETPLFKKMVQALVDGLDDYTPFSSYESQVFMARRTAGIPGYQYDVDHEKETTCRAILTKEEIDLLRNAMSHQKNHDPLHMAVFENHIPIYNIVKVSECFEATEDNINNNLVSGKYTQLTEKSDKIESQLRDLLDLKHDEELVVTRITNDDEWKASLNDSKFYELSPKVQNRVKLNCTTLKYNEYKIGRFMSESVLSMMLFKIRRASG